MPLAQPEIDERVSDLTKYEFEPPCDGRPGVEPCDHAAEWAGLFSCGHDRLWCDNHKVRCEAWHRQGRLICLTCRNYEAKVTILHIEPLH